MHAQSKLWGAISQKMLGIFKFCKKKEERAGTNYKMRYTGKVALAPLFYT